MDKVNCYKESIEYIVSSIELRKRRKNTKRQYSSFYLTTPLKFTLIEFIEYKGNGTLGVNRFRFYNFTKYLKLQITLCFKGFQSPKDTARRVPTEMLLKRSITHAKI